MEEKKTLLDELGIEKDRQVIIKDISMSIAEKLDKLEFKTPTDLLRAIDAVEDISSLEKIAIAYQFGVVAPASMA